MLASLEAVLDYKVFHCGTCLTQYGYSEKMQAKSLRKRQSKGCFNFNTKSYRIDNIIYNSCVGNYAVPIEYYVEAFRLYDEKGIMPFEGALADQPNKIISIFNIIENRRSEIAKRQVKGK